jgi:S1-C subfamily serine protease
VPRNVATCRCGVGLPEDVSVVQVRDTEGLPGGWPTFAAIALIAMLAAAGYWMFMRPAAITMDATSELTDRFESETATGAGAVVSPEARAWDAAARAPVAPRTAAPEASVELPVPTPTPLSASIEEMVDRVMPAVVLVETTSGRGSGFYVRHDTLITNVHVVQNDGYVTLRRMDGSVVTAKVETKAPALDIAILKVATPSSSQAVIPMGSGRALKAGQEIIVIGSALGTLQNSVSRGIVSGLRTAGGATLVQTDAATNPGNSGGPMLDRNGAVIAITTMGYRNAEGLNFGVAIEHARDLLEGRQTYLGDTGGLNDIQSRAGGSESDQRQQQGEDQLRGGIRKLAEAAGRIDADWKQFRNECFTSPIAGRHDREWFAVLVPRAIPTDAAAGCISYYNSLESNIKQFQGLMRRLLADARRANVLPGTIRDGLRENRLEFDWER